jgi:eukaryotic-like serine/threonine-protein kinase
LPDRYLGRQIGKYRVIRLLGAGAFAWVYEAIDRDLEIPVALKILRPEFAGQDSAEQRFRREAATAARLRHPNIVTVRDVGQSDGASFVAMDLLPLSLARRLELVTRLPEPEVVRLGLDVAAALAIAHAGGIIHRDIKPDNILIGPNGEGVVADFGLARALSSDVSLSATNQVMGTPHYFSPEQARGLELDGRSDLYSLGVTLFRAVTGRLPFEGEDWYAIARHHVETPPPSPQSIVPDVSPEFEAVLLRLLAKKPEERFDSAIALADVLATLPTAPVSRGNTMTPHSSSQTVLDLTPVRSHEALQRTLRRKRARNVGIAGVIVAALWAADWKTGVVRELLGRIPSADTLPGTGAPPIVNSVNPAGSNPLSGDTTQRVGVNRDSLALVNAIGGLGTPKPVNGPTRTSTPPTPLRGVLTVSAPENAKLYVNNELVGTGTWTGERAAGRYAVRAVIPDVSQLDCKTAKAETEVSLARGQRLDVPLEPRACVQLAVSVTPIEARVIFTPLDGGTPVALFADRPMPAIPSGRYVISATAPRCYNYGGDTADVKRTPDDKPFTRRVKMRCDP